MTIRVALTHRTTYTYDRPITVGAQVVRLRPAPHSRTKITAYSLRVEPEDHFLNWQQDVYGNYLARLVFDKLTTRFEVCVDLVAEMEAFNPFDFFLEPDAEEVPFGYSQYTQTELHAFLVKSKEGPLFDKLVKDNIPKPGMRTIDFLVAINQMMEKRIDYLVRMEPGVQTPEETLQKGSGSCRDTAWLLVQALRHMGYAARFASGYLIQLKPDVKPLSGPEGPESDFTDLHAWTEVYLPGAGWVGLDPTSGLFCGEGHIPLACTPSPNHAAPIEGAIDDCEVDFSHHMGVSRISETPRVTKPYREEQWQEVLELGARVDEVLEGDDVRLTMGGEPTFVSTTDMESPEWNTAALGPSKAGIAAQLLGRLNERFAPGGVRHFGQGKWYPGESLPRWAYDCFFMRDGSPLWRNPSLIGGPKGDNTDKDARVFVDALSERLEVGRKYVQAGYEDALYYMWKEGRLPSNLDPRDNRLSNKEDRARLTKVFEQGLSKVVGFALPLEPVWTSSGTQFISGPLFMRTEHLFLVPGDSPMGFRLPLDGFPWAAEGDQPFLAPRDPFVPQGRPDAHYGDRRVVQYREREGLQPSREAGSGKPAFKDGERLSGQPLTVSPDVPPTPHKSAAHVVRTVLCVESRNGVLHVFLPPVAYFDAYRDLLTAIEDVAARLSMPVRLEGYKPPSDPRVVSFSITPDPGVIEVNIHPNSNFAELTERTVAVYEEARMCGLASEKFMMDGRHTGTGGGNHVTLGGAQPTDSPFLRRPDMLRSLVGYFHDHPALSYLFSGMFIGPSSQAPRIDEARHEYVHELEVAFSQIPDRDGYAPPWLIDRILRHLLTDMTGNTHRAEFCIDKLYSPDGPAGRLGIVEMRAFEMPPHARMSVVQQLLVRAMIAWFWNTPYRPKLPRWGTSLHDRFLLPHFVKQDFDDVLADLRTAGFVFDPAWFAPHFEFRFPHIGEVARAGLSISLRTALEPWHVLGEESQAGSTARYVDSSVERVQIMVNNAVDRRHAVSCNGVRVPLFPTGVRGEYVAGVRYRAWQPPSCLHPTIGVDTPLRFDVLDTWSDRSVGGCTYHVSHPGGRSFDTFPVNASEAETRRAARFEALGHTPGPVAMETMAPDPEFPLTLDLRRT